MFAARPWKLAPVQVMVYRSAFVKISSPTNTSHTRFWSYWFHPFVPINGPNPLDGACAKNVIESTKRAKGNPIVKKTRISTNLIKKIIDKFATEEASLKYLRIAGLRPLGFAGFFRLRELSNMLCKHMAFLGDHIKIFVPLSKTDIYREGSFVYIGKTLTKYCPVSILLRYMREAKLTPRAIFRCSAFKEAQAGIYHAFFETSLFEMSGSVQGSSRRTGMRSEGLWLA